MNKYIKQLLNSKFIRNVVIVAMGTVGAQAITMLSAPFITRIYSPEVFGHLGIFIAILSILTPVVALTYPIAIVLPQDDDEAKSIVQLSISLSFVMSALIGVIIFFFGAKISNYFEIELIHEYFFLIPIAMFFSGMHQIAEQWIIRLKKFGITAKSAVIHSFIVNLSKVGLGLFYPFVAVLVFIQALSSLIFTLLLFVGIGKTLIFNSYSFKLIKEVAIHYKDFAIFRTPQVVVNAISQSLPVLMLASYYGAAAAGFYTLGRTILSIPSGLIGKSVGDVFYPRVSEAANNNEKLYPLIKKATFLLFIVGFIPFSIIILLGPLVFSFIFGDEWFKAGEYSRWIAVWVFFMFLNNPSVKAIPILNLQGFHLLFSIITIAIRLLALFVGYYFYSDDIVSIMLFSLVGAVMNILLITWILIACSRLDKRVYSNG